MDAKALKTLIDAGIPAAEAVAILQGTDTPAIEAGSNPRSTPTGKGKGKASGDSKVITCWTVRESDRGKDITGPMYWRGFNSGALKLPKGITDAYSLGEAIAKALNVPLEVK